MNINVRWSDNTATLRANLAQGLNSIEATRASVEKMVNALSGDKLIIAAHKYTAAVEAMGGVEKLNANEKERINALVTKAIEKYELLGKVAPDALLKLRDATTSAASSWEQFVKGFNVESAIANPMGTAKNAVVAFADTLGPANVALLATAASALAVGTALFHLTEKAAAVGGKLNDLSEKTGLSVPALSRLSNAAQVAGTDIDQLTTATFKLQKGIGEDSEAVSKGLGKIGLTIEQLKAAGPDRYLELIADGFKATEDPALRAAATTEIFKDKTGEMIPVLLKLSDALKTTADIPLWSAEQAADAEQFEMQLASLKVHAEALGLSLGRDLIPWVSAFVGYAVDLGEILVPLTGKMTGLTSLAHIAGEAWRTAAAGVRMFRGEVEKMPAIPKPPAGYAEWLKHVAALGKGPDSLGNLAEVILDLTEQQRLHELELSKAATAHKKAEDAATKHREAAEKLAETLRKLEVIMPGLRIAVGELDTTELKAIETHLKNVEALGKVREAAIKLQATLRALQRDDFAFDLTGLENVGTKTDDIERLKAQIKAAADATKEWHQTVAGLAQSFAQLAQIGGDSFGDLARDIGTAVVAFDMATRAVDAYKNATTSAGKAAAAASFIAGSAAALAQATATGSTKSRTASGAASGAAMGSAFGPWGTAIGAGVGALVGFLRGQAAEKSVNKIREAFVQAAGGLAELDKRAHEAGITLEHLLDAKTPEAYTAAIEELNAAIQFQEDAIGKVEAAVKKYGFSIEELGPAFARQQLDKQAQVLYEDFQLLTAAGIPLENVLKKMAPDINAFVQTALKAGTEIPASMKPILQKMIEHGDLLDENGNAYESLEATGLSFSETMTEGFKKLIASVEKLTAAIARSLGLALEGLPDTVPDPFRNWKPPVLPDYPGGPAPRRDDEDGGRYMSLGGRVTATGIESFGMSSLSGPRGSDTVAAWLTPGETVIPKGAGFGGGTSTTIQMYMTPTVNLTSDDANDPDRVLAAVELGLREDRNSFRTKIEHIAVKAMADA